MEKNNMIRELIKTSKEINRIMSIWKESTICAHNFISKDYWLKNYEVVKEEYIPMADTYVYLENNEIKGFISIINKEFIGALFLEVGYQGRGTGSQLIDYVKSLYNYLELAVYKDNEASVHFYKKVGFTIIREEVNDETKKTEYIMDYTKGK